MEYCIVRYDQKAGKEVYEYLERVEPDDDGGWEHCGCVMDLIEACRGCKLSPPPGAAAIRARRERERMGAFMDDEGEDDLAPTMLKDFKVGEFFLIHEDTGAVALFGVCSQEGAVTHTKRLGYFKGYNGRYYGHEVKTNEDFDSAREVEFWENTWIDFGRFWE